MRLDKNEGFGVIYDETNTIRGLWLADEESTRNTTRLQMIIASEETKGKRVEQSDYATVTLGSPQIRPGPPNIGGYIIMFPSARA